jgi:hypothetical protein
MNTLTVFASVVFTSTIIGVGFSWLIIASCVSTMHPHCCTTELDPCAPIPATSGVTSLFETPASKKIKVVFASAVCKEIKAMFASAAIDTCAPIPATRGVKSLFERLVYKKIKGIRLSLKRINCQDDRTVLQKHADATNFETRNLMIMKLWTVAVALSVAWIRYTR